MTTDNGADGAAMDELEAPAIAPTESDEPEIVFEDEVSSKEPSDDDLEEVEREGKKYKVSKALKAELLMQADYTRKTQEVAEARKAFEAEQKSFRETSEEVLKAKADIVHADRVISDFAKINWDEFEAQDPLTAQQRWRQYQQWKEHRATLDKTLADTTQALDVQHSEKNAKRVEEVVRTIQSKPGWTPDTDKANLDYVKKVGFSEAFIKANLTPELYDLVDNARRWDAAVAKAKTKATPPAPATTAPALEPTTTLTKAKAPARVVLSDKMSADEWIKARNQQVQRRRYR